MRTAVAVVLASALAVASASRQDACSGRPEASGGGGSAPAATAHAESKSAPALAGPGGITWALVELGAGRPVPPGVEVTLVFDGDRVAGRGGCNMYGGDVRFPAPGALEVGPLMATKRWCGSPASDVERDFLAALEQAGRFERDGDHLRLVTGTQESPVELIFEARPLPAQD